MTNVRTRFAPSPTGGLHIGGVRTALFCYLYAQKHNGQFILRIEDTDQTRYVAGSEAYIIENLAWCGINPDESPQIGGQYAPYRQSERKQVGIYQQYADKLIADGNAYYCFDTPQELDALRKEYELEGKRFQYDAHTRLLPQLKNSLTLSPQELKQYLEAGKPSVIRLKMPLDELIELDDLIRGKVTFKSDLSDDKILLKADAMPTYHLAVVVDDYLMRITHAFRGEEWLPSAPIHIKLYEYLGWKEQMPKFAHLPLILKPDGKGKLSKRDGDRLGFPVYALAWTSPETGIDTMGFREQGFLPQAVVNFLAMLGWNSGTEQEIFTMNQLIENFDIERVNKAGAKFDYEKAKWFNQQFIKAMDNADLAKQFINSPQAAPFNHFSWAYWLKTIALFKDRLVLLNDFWREAQCAFQAPQSYDQNTLQKKWKPEFEPIFEQLINQIKNDEVFSPESIDLMLKQFMHDCQIKAGDLMPLLRICLTGTMGGPALPDLMALLGANESANRVRNALNTLGFAPKTNDI